MTGRSFSASPFLLGLATFVMGAPVLLPTLVVGITDALSMPSFQSIVPSIVERPQIASAIALNSTQFNLSRILGPAIAGVLMASVGAVGAFAVSAASYVPFILVAWWILPQTVSVTSLRGGFDHRKLMASVREVLHEGNLRGALVTVLVSSFLCAPLITFCPVLVKEVFQGDISHFSLSMGAFGVGGLLGAVGLLAVNPDRDRRPLSSGFALAYGVVVVLVSVNRWSWGLPLLLVLAGFTMTASNASANALLQAAAPARIRGQTVSLFMLAMRGGIALGGLATGVMVGLLGVREALLVNGVLAVLAHTAIRRPWLRAPLPKDMARADGET
jgi:predicted MFS family arabinose efflux permease